jgi:hypothetical protein
MSDSRPTVDPVVVATAIDGAPDRVRRRLDRTPDAAATWDWTCSQKGWTVQAGEEIVQLPTAHVAALDQVSCSCLLAPNCFHVMACLTGLEVSAAEDLPSETASEESVAESDGTESVLPDELQMRAADDLATSLRRLLNVGITGAGVAVQSGLMRAVHQGRAAGLHRAAAVGLRVIEGTRQVRRRAAAADPLQLARDIADCLETTRQIGAGSSVAAYWVGTARRKQSPVRPKRLHGLLAEPILTRSGYAGVAVYFLGEDDRIYSVSDVRPGSVQLCRGAYRGGIDIGPIVEPAIKLARSQYLGSELTASHDGRMGRGKSIKIAAQGASDWNSPAIQQRFAADLADQWDRVYGQTSLPPDVRPAGWDFVFVRGSIVGAAGPELLLSLDRDKTVIRLAITNDSEQLCFRENLRMLSHAPGLSVKLIGRLDLEQPTRIEPLALMAADVSSNENESTEKPPSLDLPDEFAGRVNLGLDPIPRHSLINALAKPVVFGGAVGAAQVDWLAPLQRRWVAMMLGGTSSQHRTVTNTIAGEIASLNRAGFATAASLLDAMSRQDLGGNETFLATAVYLRRCTSELAKAQANLS